jgi:hypothetical protein
MVKARELSRKAILEAIRQGLFYSSTGPVIEDLKIAGGKISLVTSPVKMIDFIADGILGIRRASLEKNICLAEYELTGQERYLRIEITDEKGKKAWTNPVLLKDLK